ncbi:hypothetical protein CEXT_236591 [Caerostris extrusa]|uniref:Uncharacterized protein n=1 Tax=Caerostris extrusa TaxID=172846 RepID=A0AAV4XH56_CAEEX|nr:hypothetical protein CEXT_236591 [Caerostris extrusa]
MEEKPSDNNHSSDFNHRSPCQMSSFLPLEEKYAPSWWAALPATWKASLFENAFCGISVTHAANFKQRRRKARISNRISSGLYSSIRRPFPHKTASSSTSYIKDHAIKCRAFFLFKRNTPQLVGLPSLQPARHHYSKNAFWGISDARWKF